jgi:influenza virus NS1A-binding protein
MDLSSCLEIRSTPYVASSATNGDVASRKASKEDDEKRKRSVEEVENGDDLPDDGLSQRYGFNLVGRVDEHIASADLSQLQNNREFLSLPRFCVEVLHSCKEEIDAAQPKPLCELVLDWSHRKWLDDSSLQIDEAFLQRSPLLIMSKDHSLQDCMEVEEGSELDSVQIQDYRKSNQHLDKPKPGSRKVARKKPGSNGSMKPSKPKEMLYTRQIKHDDHGDRDEHSEQYYWKVIVAHRLDNRSLLGVASMDGKLVILSIVQRINVPNAACSDSSPTMARSISETSLKAGLKSPVSKSSRPPSLDKDVYIPVACMKYARCAAGVVSLSDRLVVCGGFDRGECLSKVEAYDLATNTWEKWPSMLSKRGRFDATVLDNGWIYCAGGSNGHSDMASVEVYKPEAGKWSPAPSLPIALSNIGKMPRN